VTRGQLPQRAGLPGLNGGGAAAAVPPHALRHCLIVMGSLPLETLPRLIVTGRSDGPSQVLRHCLIVMVRVETLPNSDGMS